MFTLDRIFCTDGIKVYIVTVIPELFEFMNELVNGCNDKGDCEFYLSKREFKLVVDYVISNEKFVRNFS